MAESSVLREFLVKIGFKIDETKYRDFQESMRTTAKNAVEMSKTAVAAATTMGAAIHIVATQMEGLYFATRRTGASAMELKELGFAAEQVGVSAEQARGAVEGLAAARRTNPDLNGILGGMGIDPRQTDNAKVLVKLLAKLHSMPYYQGAQIAGMFGIDERTFAMMEQGLPEMQKYLALREKMFKDAGVNPDDVANRSHEFQTRWRIFEAQTGTLAEVIAYRLMPVGEKLLDWLTTITSWLLKADGATGGLSSKLLALSAIGSRFAIKGALGMAAKLLGGGAMVAEGAEGAAVASAGAEASTGVGIPLAALTALGIGGFEAYKHRKAIADWFKRTKDSVSELAGGIPESTAQMIAGFEGFRDKTYKDIAGNATVFFGHKLAAGESIAGLNPMTVLMSDIGKALAAVHQLVKVHISKNQESALADFVFNLGAKNLANSTLLRKLNAGDYAGAADQFQYWNHAFVNGHLASVKALTDRRSAESQLFRTPDRPISIQQKNDYHITSTDPQGAASEVERRQNRVNADLARNFAGAYQ